jgi:hypothetical protein
MRLLGAFPPRRFLLGAPRCVSELATKRLSLVMCKPSLLLELAPVGRFLLTA